MATPSTVTTTQEPATRGANSLVWTRIASFISILPLGVWTVNHLWDNLAALSGPLAWERAVTYHAHPVAHGFTVFIVLLPLALHTIWGIQRMFSFRPNNGAYSNYANLKYLVQRITALGALGFLGAHIWLAMLRPRLLLGRAETFAEISREMHHHLPTLIVYLLGTTAVCYHLANGLQSFAWTWGIAAGRRSMRIIDRIAIIAFVILTAMSWTAIFALYRAGE